MAAEADEAETKHAYRPYKKESRTCEGSIKIPEECPRINAFKVVGPRIPVSDHQLNPVNQLKHGRGLGQPMGWVRSTHGLGWVGSEKLKVGLGWV